MDKLLALTRLLRLGYRAEFLIAPRHSDAFHHSAKD